MKKFKIDRMFSFLTLLFGGLFVGYVMLWFFFALASIQEGYSPTGFIENVNFMWNCCFYGWVITMVSAIVFKVYDRKKYFHYQKMFFNSLKG